MRYSDLFLYGFLLCLVVGLAGCLNVATTGAQMAYHHRNLQKNLQDQYITLRAYRSITVENPEYQRSNVTITTVNGNVLITGQVPEASQINMASTLAEKIPGVDRVYNFMTVSKASTPTMRLNDAWITAKIKAKMIASSEMDASSVKVITENGTVFLMGTLQHDEANVATTLARETDGVSRVIKIFKYFKLIS